MKNFDDEKNEAHRKKETHRILRLLGCTPITRKDDIEIEDEPTMPAEESRFNLKDG